MRIHLAFQRRIAHPTLVDMSSHAAPNAPSRLRSLHDALFRAYGPQHWWPAQTPFEVVVGAYLTQNTAWAAVERSLDQLRERDALTPDGLLRLNSEELQHAIRPSGFATRKAASLQAFVQYLNANAEGSLQRLSQNSTVSLRDALLHLPGVGPETADAILLYALDHTTPMADEYLRRVVERHQLLDPAPGRNRRGYEAMIHLTGQAFAHDPEEQRLALYKEFHALIVSVGKHHCKRTPRCAGCPLYDDLAQHNLQLLSTTPEKTLRRT